jgi:DNA repair protein RecO
MHHIYETNAFVLKNTPHGEADALLTIFTEELGIIFATAQGIRYEKSKLRFATQKLSFCHVSLVRGKGTWRLTNAVPIENNFTGLNPEVISSISRILKLVERLVAGESVDEKLFSIVSSGINFLKDISNRDDFNKDLALDAEVVIVLRILNRLGYIGSSEQINFYILSDSWDGEVIEKMKSERREALRVINSGIRESQL